MRPTKATAGEIAVAYDLVADKYYENKNVLEYKKTCDFSPNVAIDKSTNGQTDTNTTVPQCHF